MPSPAALLVFALTSLFAVWPAQALPCFGPEELVQAGGIDIDVLGSSTPCLVEWDEDGLPDLVIGEGGSSHPGRVRVYKNVGTEGAPLFNEYSYVRSEGDTLTVPGCG